MIAYNFLLLVGLCYFGFNNMKNNFLVVFGLLEMYFSKLHLENIRIMMIQ